MGCFLPCFGASKRPKHIHSANAAPSTHQTHVADADIKVTEFTKQKIIEEPITDTESKIKLEGRSNESGIKKITFDLNANANEELSAQELVKKLEESSIEPEKAGHEEAPQTDDGPNPKAIADNVEDKKKSGDEEEGEGRVNGISLPEESSDSLFSLSIDSRKQVTATEKAENEVNSLMPLRGVVCNTTEESRDGVQNVGLGLRPIKNLAQGETIKETAKENINLFKIKLEGPPNCIAKRKVDFDLNVHTNQESSAKDLTKRLNENKEDHEETPQRSECTKSRASGKSSDFSRYRYRDCSDEEWGDFDLDESDLGDTFVDDERRGEEEVNGTWTPEESSESLFSLSTGSRIQVSAAEKAENEVNSPMPARGARIQNVSSVLNPIENLRPGKVVKATIMPPSKYEKENMISEPDVDIFMSAEPSLKVPNGKARNKKFNDKKQDEIGVDTSLSSWLVETETTPKSKNSTNSVGDSTAKGGRGSTSPLSHEDRPILGALSIEELRKYSVSTPSRRCKSRSPDETPIIGTVGSYWSHTEQTINSDSSSCCSRMPKAGSKSREDCKVKWNSSPVKARLERAFDVAQL